VAGQGKDRRPTRNRIGGGACQARDRGGSMIPLGTREFHQHARSHARSQLETIMREQRPGGEGSRVPAKERRQEGASRRNRRSGERRGRPKPRSAREGDPSEITTFRRCRLYRRGLSRGSAIPESRATGATTSPIARDCNRPIDEVRGLPSVQSVKQGQRNTVRRKEGRVTVKPLDKDCP